MKTWTPDTCPSPGCIIEEIYNGTDIVGAGAIVRKCAAHANVPDADLYGVLYSNPNGENKMKNAIYSILLGIDEPQLDLKLSQSKPNVFSGGNDLVLKDGVTFDWNFKGSDDSRVIECTINGSAVTPTQKLALQDVLDTKFEVGKAVIK
jgi:hypothetical protein